MSASLQGARFVVTGAARGIGRAVAETLVAHGGRVVVNDLDPTGAAAAASSLCGRYGDLAVACPGDVRDPAVATRLVAAAVEWFGGLDGAVCNAGVYPVTPALEMTTEEWDRVMDTNAKGTFLVAQAVARRIIDQGSPGHILAIASGSWHLAREGCAHYCASKAAQVMLCRVLAMEWARHGIRVNCIAPGLIDNPYSGGEYKQAFLQRIPAGRIGRPEDVAAACLMVFTAATDYFTGQVIEVDGGAALGRYGLPVEHRRGV